MELIILVFSIWAVCNGIKSLSRIKPKASRTTATATKASGGGSQMSTLKALQEQRDRINNQFKLIDDSLNTLRKEYRAIQLAAIKARTATDRDKARKRMITLESKLTQIENKRTSLYGRLAIVESKISKLIY